MNDKTVQHIKKLYHDGLSIRYISKLMQVKKGKLWSVLKCELQAKKEETKRIMEEFDKVYYW